MATRKNDRRVRRTKRVIRDALIKLMLDKPVAGVTITELCREADINRNTFYAHYSAPEDVFAEIENELLADLSSMLEEENVTVSICRAIDEDRNRWRAIWYGSPRLLKRAWDTCCENVLAQWDAQNLLDVEEGKLFLLFITRGASGLIGNWLDEGCRMPPEEIGAIIERFVFQGLQGISDRLL